MIRRQIPNLITLGNLLCGVIAIAAALRGDLTGASLMICLGIFLDFFDGLAARLLNVASPLGKELDSLADVVTSGVAPGFILWNILCNGVGEKWPEFLPYTALLIPLFAAYRLAKFNIDSRQSHSFLGLPTPANALIWVGVALTPALPMDELTFIIVLIVVSLITDVLMVSELPMFSLKFNFKEMGWKHNSVQYLFLIGCAAIIVASRQWYAISIIILWYIILSAITQKKHAE
jgi:CDP-diacylglycerol--serine O-phosphatidyltransferase